MNAADEYFMSQMNVRRRQVVIDLSKDHSAIIQAGAMQWMGKRTGNDWCERNRGSFRKSNQRGL